MPDWLRAVVDRADRRALQVAVSWTVFLGLAWGLGAIADSPRADAQAEQRGQARQDPPLDGEVLWRRDCASCHGAGGDGTAWGPSLQDKGPAGVYLNVTTGRMPIEQLSPLHDRDFSPNDLEITRNVRGGTKYLPGQIAALVEYSRQILAGPDVPIVDVASADASQGFDLFQRNCASCHAWSARGGTLANGHVATSLQTSSPDQVVAAMRTGLGTMPEFADTAIDDEEAADIAAYVTYLDSPRNEGGHPMNYIGPAAEGFAAWTIGILGVLLVVRWIGKRS